MLQILKRHDHASTFDERRALRLKARYEVNGLKHNFKTSNVLPLFLSHPLLAPNERKNTTTKHKVDLVCCLTSKHEKSGGGAGSLAEIYAADGTGFSSSMPGNVWDGRRDAALLKGMRAALGKPDWSPGNPRPPPVPAHLKIEVTENKREVRSMGFFIFQRARTRPGLGGVRGELLGVLALLFLRCCLLSTSEFSE